MTPFRVIARSHDPPIARSLDFDAGQTCDLTIRSPQYQDEKGSSRTFLIASPPAEAPRVMVATRLTGSAFKRSLPEAPVGYEIELEGPSGSFVRHRNTAKPAVFFASKAGGASRPDD